MKFPIDFRNITPSTTPSMCFAEFIQGFLANLDYELGSLMNNLGNKSGGRVLSRQLSLLCDYLDMKYRDGGSSKSEKELLIDHKFSVLPANWKALLKCYVRDPFIECVSKCGNDDFIKIHKLLLGTVHALTGKDLEKMVSGDAWCHAWPYR